MTARYFPGKYSELVHLDAADAHLFEGSDYRMSHALTRITGPVKRLGYMGFPYYETLGAAVAGRNHLNLFGRQLDLRRASLVRGPSTGELNSLRLGGDVAGAARVWFRAIAQHVRTHCPDVAEDVLQRALDPASVDADSANGVTTADLPAGTPTLHVVR